MPSPPEVAALLARHQAAVRYLFGRINYERVLSIPYHDRGFKLDRMQELLDRLGNPDRAMRIVHVAGTKGKGSTSTILGSILRAAGQHVGLFTSPHLERIEERLAVDDTHCSAEELVDLVDTLTPIIEAMDRERPFIDDQPDGPTYFEITTAMALLHFARRQVDTAVLEVGLGGRLDSTNVCQPNVSVITSISLDHVQQLGGTLESIAREKAGIIKPGIPLVSGVTASGPRDVIREICHLRGSRLLEVETDFDVDYRPPRDLDREATLGEIDFQDRTGPEPYRLEAAALGLLGRHQARNAAVALAVIGELRRQGWQITDEAVRTGLANARCPARVEVLSRRPTVVVDAAHNRASIEALVTTLEESFSPHRRILVFATTQEKDISGMLHAAVPHFDEILLTRYQHNPRAVPPKDLAELAQRLTGRVCRVCSKPEEAWQMAQDLMTRDDLVCVSGSFFIAAEMRQLVIGQADN
jgi:dihydrofolate synthase / folylpolyglutamate synthase